MDIKRRIEDTVGRRSVRPYMSYGVRYHEHLHVRSGYP
jgi:hypothetical protein